MSGRKGWDLTSVHSCEAAAEWIRKNAGALLVLVVRPEDVAFAIDPQISPGDASAMVEVAMPEAMASLQRMRLDAKAKRAMNPFANQ